MHSSAADLLFTPYAAIEELERRRSDSALLKKVEVSLNGDIPEYFTQGPILHLARHMLTPNFETIRFLYLMQHVGLRAVVSQDSKGLFVSQNLVKRALGKLPICRRVTQKDGTLHEQFQNVTVIDFNTSDGKIFSEIGTFWGEKLVNFHIRLFSELNLTLPETPDDADWLDRHHRGDLLAHYKELLSLFVGHGIFFETYNEQDEHEAAFVRDILRPACLHVKERFGYAPLICQLFPTSFESYRFWLSYPAAVLDIIRKANGGVVP